MDQKSEKEEEFGFEREGRKGTLEVPPVVIKGGSIEVEFPIEPFDAPEHGKKVKLVKHPKNTEITIIEVRDPQKNVINTYRLPANLKGKCYICIWDNSP
ncbi:MAG: hypothetical protein H7Z16_07430 [Pyrinomonadaceae bacterium]|nr:hypothetical protein [Pyrinomonadaceae bacterium]